MLVFGLALALSARCFQMFTTGMGASCRGFAGARSAFLRFPFSVDFPGAFSGAFSESFSTDSTDFSTEVEACDLFSHVESDEVFGIEDTSSSLVTVEADEAPRSGEDTMEAVETRESAVSLGASACGCMRGSCELDVFSERASFASASSAQLITAAEEALDDRDSFAGVAEPEDDLLGAAEEAGPEDRPFAAWA